ncbi:uncharacterized protein L969DRAFT_93051 [Mixia osmundae IAM 14324]|uniref:SART-1 protein n=1 Tax=Mixia osmundae (strain CBS 9802 / IAM 14324 / JCM 22182 / KY 12970) TaxID=764103 RepID=G7E691_MIXOS|nr:uncharacterized protein L969DRAFT_93051 [Mixia osmundae IAM 14324]KEI40494.1 hypothetical protein L969DRAFT_93051 [Mixia osmundae IAM 14324]GAA98351.1 hypothetical protein E5Q_05037 [Mixia osmundae IAM 14324]
MTDATGRESLTLAETNKVRESLGLAPLADGDPSSPATLNEAELKVAEAESNYAARKAEEAQERAAKEAQTRLDKIRTKRELAARLKGKTLAESQADAEEEDTLSWLKKSRVRQRENADRLAREASRSLALKEKEQREAASKYTEQDLKGIKVSHDIDQFDSLGEEGIILTLKDGAILDGGDDELHNLNLEENAKHDERVKSKQKKSAYTGYDDEEFLEDDEDLRKPGASTRKVLSKYDEDINGKEQSGFRLGGEESQSAQAIQARQLAKNAAANDHTRRRVDLSFIKNLEASDYLQEGEKGFKVKKRRPKPKATRKTSDDLEADIRPSLASISAGLPAEDKMQVEEHKSTAARRRQVEALDESTLVDDDELQAALARQRRAQLKRRPVLRAEEIASQVLEEKTARATPDAVMRDPNEDSSGGLIFDDTTEFVKGISLERAAAQPARRPRVKSETPQEMLVDSTEEVKRVNIKDLIEAGELDPDTEMQLASQAEEGEEQEGIKVEEDEALPSTANEKLVSGGMAATLALLRQRGLVKPMTDEERKADEDSRQKSRWIAERRLEELQRLQERAASRAAGTSKDQHQREYENRQREIAAARQSLDSFRDYKPNVNIQYTDEFGRSMTPKEAWKALSHHFHGKGSGTAKRAKRLKQIEEERKREAMAASDTPLSTMNAFAARQERLGSATMVLSVGNRDAAPMTDNFADTLRSGKTAPKRTKESKASGQPAIIAQDAIVNLTPTLATQPGTIESRDDSPKPKAGFRSIKAAPAFMPHSVNRSAQRASTPPPSVVEEASSAKRKAEGEVDDTPPAKRR